MDQGEIVQPAPCQPRARGVGRVAPALTPHPPVEPGRGAWRKQGPPTISPYLKTHFEFFSIAACFINSLKK